MAGVVEELEMMSTADLGALIVHLKKRTESFRQVGKDYGQGEAGSEMLSHAEEFHRLAMRAETELDSRVQALVKLLAES
jgi:hypothetical protein